jgi:hypothetical protein
MRTSSTFLSPLRHALDERAAYIAAALTITRAYLAAGAPQVCGALGSYPEWSRMVRSPLVWLPVQVDPDRIKAEYRDGLLALFLPRADSDKPRSIEIK